MGLILIAEEDEIKGVVFNRWGAALSLHNSVFKKQVLEIDCDNSKRDLLKDAKKVRITIELI
ncbi:MAG: hypothetical protein KJ674_01360 [Nanoarchaeota archaeon]|nr:hypothetical protein [Nanoarchaeota archaeon]